MEYPPITIKDIQVEPNGNGKHKVLVAYTQPALPAPQPCPKCSKPPKLTAAERQIKREQDKIKRANDRIAQLTQGPDLTPATPKELHKPFKWSSIFPKRKSNSAFNFRRPDELTKAERKFFHTCIGIALGAALATVYIAIKIS